VAATGGDAGVASVIFRHTERGGELHTLAFQKTPDGIVTTPGVCDCRESTRRVLNLPAREFTATIDPVSESIPVNVRWQLNILVPRMIGGLKKPVEPESGSGPEAGDLAIETAPPQVELPIDSYTVRVVVGQSKADEQERLESVEILEQPSGKRVNGAWWLDRPGGPGVIIGMDGVAYERLIWESPLIV
jgi:hypothetical protein